MIVLSLIYSDLFQLMQFPGFQNQENWVIAGSEIKDKFTDFNCFASGCEAGLWKDSGLPEVYSKCNALYYFIQLKTKLVHLLLLLRHDRAESWWIMGEL